MNCLFHEITNSAVDFFLGVSMQPVVTSLSNLPFDCIDHIVRQINGTDNRALPAVRTCLRWSRTSSGWNELLSYWTDRIDVRPFAITEFDEAIKSSSPLQQSLEFFKRFAPRLSGELMQELVKAPIAAVSNTSSDIRSSMGTSPTDVPSVREEAAYRFALLMCCLPSVITDLPPNAYEDFKQFASQCLLDSKEDVGREKKVCLAEQMLAIIFNIHELLGVNHGYQKSERFRLDSYANVFMLLPNSVKAFLLNFVCVPSPLCRDDGFCEDFFQTAHKIKRDIWRASDFRSVIAPAVMYSFSKEMLSHRSDSSDLIIISARTIERWLLSMPANRRDFRSLCQGHLEAHNSAQGFEEFAELRRSHCDAMLAFAFLVLHMGSENDASLKEFRARIVARGMLKPSEFDYLMEALKNELKPIRSFRELAIVLDHPTAVSQ